MGETESLNRTKKRRLAKKEDDHDKEPRKVGPKEGICAFWVKKKQRFCKWPALHGDKFCANHTQSNHAGDGKRIPCPLDPTHTVFENRLNYHLKNCNMTKLKAKQQSCKYYRKNINVETDPTSKAERIILSELDKGYIEKVITKLNNAIKELVPAEVSFTEGKYSNIANNNNAEKDDESENFSKRALKRAKHELQQTAILDHLFNIGFTNGIVPDYTCFVEMGAGNGGLSVATRNKLAIKNTKYENISHVLVDRSSFKVRNDRKITQSKAKDWERIKIDIRDLKLFHVDKVADAKNVVVYSKHLCGAATCYTLRACISDKGQLVDKLSKNEKTGALRLPRVISIALCCHQVCDWDAYPNRELMVKFGIERKEFDVIRKLSSWATCFGLEKDSEHAPSAEEESGKTTSFEDPLPFTREEKEDIGQKCKMLLNCGRVLYLRSHGYRVHLVKYIAKDVTIENTMLLAVLPDDK